MNFKIGDKVRVSGFNSEVTRNIHSFTIVELMSSWKDYPIIVQSDDPKGYPNHLGFRFAVKESEISMMSYAQVRDLEVANGSELDLIGELYGVSRWGDFSTVEADQHYRERIIKEICDIKSLPNNHLGHEVVENFVEGKPFKYCRKCKEEVL